MPPDSLQAQLTKYLGDVHAIERQALVQMRAAPKLAGDEQLAEAFAGHRAETEWHERLVRERLEARDAHPSPLKDAIGLMTGHGFGLFAALQPDTPGKLVAHAYSYEHMEEAANDILGMIAARAGDEPTLEAARQIEAQEHAMGDRLEAAFGLAVEISLQEVRAGDLDHHLNAYLADAHAIEGQAIKLLETAVELADAPQLAEAFHLHLNETRDHEQWISARLSARGAAASKVKDAALKLGAFNWGGFFGVQPDTPIKLAAFAYAFEHIEIAAYELLRRVAERTGDRVTVETVERIIVQETDAARSIRSLFSEALDATLAARDLA